MRRIIFFSLLFFNAQLLLSQDVTINVTGKIWDQPDPMDSIIVENLTQPDTLIFGDLPQSITTYVINLSTGVCINDITDHNGQGGISLIGNQPGHQKLFIGVQKPELLTFSIFTIEAKTLLRKEIFCNQKDIIDIFTGNNRFCVLNVMGQSVNTSFLIQGGSENKYPDIRKTDEKPVQYFTKRSGNFTFSAGDIVKISGIKQGLYSNFVLCIPYDGYSVDIYLSKPCPSVSMVTDYDSNVYHTVQIGDQCWMRENMKSKHYANGDALVDGTGIGSWLGNIKYWFDYDDDPTNSEIYGRLYTGDAACNGYVKPTGGDTILQGICPDGWHLPSNQEWGDLETFLGVENGYVTGCEGTNEGEYLKESGDGHWQTNYGNNKSGFTALGAGLKWNIGGFDSLNGMAIWWSGAGFYGGTLVTRGVYSIYPKICGANDDVHYAFSCRCIKD